uniref:Uncharacterized protein n=1 Tax=Panagrolaimus superbus TaxID=310955 RepID=A0A914YER2_9BILA
MTKSGTVEELKLIGVYDLTTIGSASVVPVEDIIAAVPLAKSIEIAASKITPTTFQSLISFDHKAKLVNFVLRNITPSDHYNDQLFVDFFLKNSDTSCNIRLDFELLQETSVGACHYNYFLKEMGEQYTARISWALLFILY